MSRKKSGLVGGIITALVILVAIICVTMCVERIPNGYVGVVYSMSGGVEDETLSQGFKFVAPTKSVKEFTISNEQLVLTKDERDGSEGDDSFKVATADDASISISFEMSYHYEEGMVVDTYKKYKGMNGEDIVNQRVKTVLKAEVAEVTTDYTMMDIYSGNRNEINEKIKEHLSETFLTRFGIVVDSASIIDVHPDAKLQEAIDNRVTALQQKQQAEAEQETVKIQAETALIKAENEKQIAITEAEGIAEANRLKAASITPELIQMEEVEARKEHGWVEITGVNSTVVKE